MLNAMVSKIDDGNLDGIVIRCALARTVSIRLRRQLHNFRAGIKGET